MIGKTTLVLSLFVSLACAGGDEMYKRGATLFKSDPYRALELFEEAAEAGNIAAKVGAGHCYETGRGADLDYQKALEYFKQAAQSRSPQGYEGLARIYASCPNPRYHNGANAVKFASALVKMRPGNSEAQTLLAHAYLRDMQPRQAVRHGKIAVIHSSPEKLKRRQAALAAYADGQPVPALATAEWVMEASEKGVLWAKIKLAKATADINGEMYNPQLALMMCEEAVRAGKPVMYLTMGDVYLQEKNLSKAEQSYKKYKESGHKYRSGFVPHQVRLLPELDKLAHAVFQSAVNAHKGYLDTIEVDPYVVETDKNGKSVHRYKPHLGLELNKVPPKLQDAEFLYLVAIAMGHREAGERLADLRKENSAIDPIEIPKIREQKKSPKKAFEVFTTFPGLDN